MRLFSVILCLFFSGLISAQDNSREMDRVYGLDPILYNGKKYTYFLPAGTGGTQFFESPDYVQGSVIINGKKYEGVELNYDVFNQQLLLRFENESGTYSIIEVSKAWLESFRLGNRKFKLMDQGGGLRFCQVLGEGPVFIVYFFRKDLKLEGPYGASQYVFSPVIRSQFVLDNGILKPYRQKRSLVSAFDPEKQQEIRNYMKGKKINPKKTSDRDMTDLINFINKL